MKRASLAAAFAASLFLGSVSACIAADEARASEERLLGRADEAAQFAAYQLFTRQIAASGGVSESLHASLAAAGASAATMLEARQALGCAPIRSTSRRRSRFPASRRRWAAPSAAPRCRPACRRAA